MTNDKKINAAVTELYSKTKSWLTIVKDFGNQDAYTDRMLEEILDSADKLRQLYDSNTVE